MKLNNIIIQKYLLCFTTYTLASNFICPTGYDQVTLVLVTHKLDSCRAHSSVLSILKYDVCNILEPILLVWNDKWITRRKGQSAVTDKYMLGLVDEVASRNRTLTLVKPWGKRGDRSWLHWGGQQIAKLRMIKLIRSPYYLVIDTKNKLIAPLLPTDLFEDIGRGRKMGYGLRSDQVHWVLQDINSLLRTLGSIPDPEQRRLKLLQRCDDITVAVNADVNLNWICRSTASLFSNETSLPLRLLERGLLWHSSTTPALLHTSTVHKLLHQFIPSRNRR